MDGSLILSILIIKQLTVDYHYCCRRKQIWRLHQVFSCSRIKKSWRDRNARSINACSLNAKCSSRSRKEKNKSAWIAGLLNASPLKMQNKQGLSVLNRCVAHYRLATTLMFYHVVGLSILTAITPSQMVLGRILSQR